jgi:type IV secretion system protein TrbL
LAEKAIGAVVSAAVKLMVLALVTSVIDPVLSAIHFQGPQITFNELWSVFLTVCALMFLCWKAPSLAASLLGGSPHLGVDHLLQAASTPIAAGLAVGAYASRAAASVSATRAAASGPQGAPPPASFSVSAAPTPAAGGGGQGPSSPLSAPDAPGQPASASGGADASLVMSAMGKAKPAESTRSES